MDELSLDVLSHCLKIDPSGRLSCEELLDHPYFDNFSDSFEKDFRNIIEKDKEDFYMRPSTNDYPPTETEPESETSRQNSFSELPPFSQNQHEKGEAVVQKIERNLEKLDKVEGITRSSSVIDNYGIGVRSTVNTNKTISDYNKLLKPSFHIPNNEPLKFNKVSKVNITFKKPTNVNMEYGNNLNTSFTKKSSTKVPQGILKPKFA
jgi:serine/threonine protein kinase